MKTENQAGFVDKSQFEQFLDYAREKGRSDIPASQAIRKLKTITSYSGLARFLAECEDAGEITKPATIKTPYVYSQTINTYLWAGKRIIIPEVRHRRYEVWQVE